MKAGSSAGLEVTVASVDAQLRRADANGDGAADISDATFTLSSPFLGARDPSCLDSADANDDGRIDVSDAVGTLGFLFLGAANPPVPGPFTCGPDPTDDDIDCRGDAACS